MREPGFDEFASLWNEPVDVREEEFEASARRARLRGRMLAYTDILLLLLVIGASIIGVFLKPSGLMLGLALLMVIGSMVVTWRRRQIRQMAKTLITTDRGAFLASSMTNARANLRRVTLSLIVFPAFVITGVIFKISWRHGGHLQHPLAALAEWAASTRGVVTLLIFGLIGAATLRSRVRLKGELRRLNELHAAYDAEATRDAEAAN